MKCLQLKYIFLSLFFLMIKSFVVIAQPVIKSPEDNIIKINVPALVFKNFSIQYEKKINAKSSFAINIRYRPSGGIPFEGFVEDWVDDSSIRVNLAKIGNFGIIPEYRFYLGKKGIFQGFYIAPMLAYNHYNGDIPVNYYDYDDVNHTSIKRTA